MIIIYRARRIDQRHPHLGVYVDIENSFWLPVGPFSNVDAARQFLSDNADRVALLYGADQDIRVQQ